MKRLLPLALLLFLIISCKNKRTTLADGDKVEITDFIEFFSEIKLPYRLTEDVIAKKETDSALIGYKIFTRFVADTVLSKQFGKKAKPKIYALGKVTVSKAESYLFVKAITATKKAAYILVFNNDRQFVVAKPLIVSDNDLTASQTAEMDTKYTLTTTLQRKPVGAKMLYKKNVYVYNSAGVFTLILTEANDNSKVDNTIINPIDTLPRKNKYSGDYIINARNYVAIRDGRKMGSMLFFIHFEKDKGTCNGELKGEAMFSGTTKAVFKQSNNPCAIEFNFSSSRVTIKEVGACGTYRDIKCFFEGSFIKKKPPVRKSKKKK